MGGALGAGYMLGMTALGAGIIAELCTEVERGARARERERER